MDAKVSPTFGPATRAKRMKKNNGPPSAMSIIPPSVPDSDLCQGSLPTFDDEDHAFFSSLYTQLQGDQVPKDEATIVDSGRGRPDLRFVVGKDKILTHKFIMEHFCNDLVPIKCKEEQQGFFVRIPDDFGVSPEAFKVFVKAIYLKVLGPTGVDTWLQVRHLAEHFGCGMILQWCDGIQLTVGNCLGVFEKFPEGTVREKALDFIKANTAALVESNPEKLKLLKIYTKKNGFEGPKNINQNGTSAPTPGSSVNGSTAPPVNGYGEEAPSATAMMRMLSLPEIKQSTRSENVSVVEVAGKEVVIDLIDVVLLEKKGSERKRCHSRSKRSTPFLFPPSPARRVATNVIELKNILLNATAGEQVELASSGTFLGRFEIKNLPEGVRIVGAGPQRTTITVTVAGSEEYFWHVRPGRNFSIENLNFKIYWPHGIQPRKGLWITGGEGLNIKNVTFEGCHLELEACNGAEISHVSVVRSHFGIVLNSATQNVVIRNAAFQKLIQGIRVIGNDNNISVANCTDCKAGVTFMGKNNCLSDFNFTSSCAKNSTKPTAVSLLSCEGNTLERVKCVVDNGRESKALLGIWAGSNNTLNNLSGGSVFMSGDHSVVENLKDCPFLQVSGMGHRFINCTVKKASLNWAVGVVTTKCNFTGSSSSSIN